MDPNNDVEKYDESADHYEEKLTERNPNLVYSRSDVPNFDEATESRLIRRIDWRLLPILGALYSIALIDRTNVSVNIFTPAPHI